jgi:hypothetical protein
MRPSYEPPEQGLPFGSLPQPTSPWSPGDSGVTPEPLAQLPSGSLMHPAFVHTAVSHPQNRAMRVSGAAAAAISWWGSFTRWGAAMAKEEARLSTRTKAESLRNRGMSGSFRWRRRRGPPVASRAPLKGKVQEKVRNITLNVLQCGTGRR